MRLIDADELKKVIEQGEGFSWDSLGKDDLCVRKKYIDNAPTVEQKYYERIIAQINPVINNTPTVEFTEEQAIDKLHETGWLPKHDKEMTERPKGEWIPRLHASENDVFVCSICKRELGYDPAYCPNCGAKMKGGT